MTSFLVRAGIRLATRDGWFCHYCGRKLLPNNVPLGCSKYYDKRGKLKGKEYRYATVDHIIPQSKGGSNADSNLVLSCLRCNHAKGSIDYETFRTRVTKRIDRIK